jgi:hypothetical protein
MLQSVPRAGDERGANRARAPRDCRRRTSRAQGNRARRTVQAVRTRHACPQGDAATVANVIVGALASARRSVASEAPSWRAAARREASAAMIGRAASRSSLAPRWSAWRRSAQGRSLPAPASALRLQALPGGRCARTYLGQPARARAAPTSSRTRRSSGSERSRTRTSRRRSASRDVAVAEFPPYHRGSCPRAPSCSVDRPEPNLGPWPTRSFSKMSRARFPPRN